MELIKIANEINKSMPSLNLDTKTMNGFYERMMKQFGYFSMARFVASQVKISQSPTIDESILSWSDGYRIERCEPIPFWLMKNLAYRIAQEEEPDTARKACSQVLL